jgi:hypothetical protein
LKHDINVDVRASPAVGKAEPGFLAVYLKPSLEIVVVVSLSRELMGNPVDTEDER